MSKETTTIEFKDGNVELVTRTPLPGIVSVECRTEWDRDCITDLDVEVYGDAKTAIKSVQKLVNGVRMTANVHGIALRPE